MAWGSARAPNARLYLAATLTGLLAGLVGAGFHASMDAAAAGLAWLRETLVQAHTPVPGWAILMTLGALVLTPAIWLVRRFAPESAGSGIQEVEAILVTGRRLRWERVLPVKLIAGSLALGAGLVMGREGPTVHMGASLGQMSAEGTKLGPAATRTLVASGAAAGLAAAFNAPLAAIVFVTEELREGFEYRFASLQSVVLASCLAVAVSDWWLGQGPDLPVPPVGEPPVAAIPLFLLLGVLIGGLGVVFNALLIGSVRTFGGLRDRHAYAVTAVLGAALGALIWLAPQATGGGEVLVEDILRQNPRAAALVALLAVRVLTSVGSYGSGLPGGIFAPLLALGTLAGGVFDSAARAFAPSLGLDPGVCAVAAMGALFAATVRAPLTGTILVLELTGVRDLALPILLTCLTATFAAEVLGGRPIYSLLLQVANAPPIRAPRPRVLVGALGLAALLSVDRMLVPVLPQAPAASMSSAARTAATAPRVEIPASATGPAAQSQPTAIPSVRTAPLAKGEAPAAATATAGPPAPPASQPAHPQSPPVPAVSGPVGKRYAIQLLTVASDRHLAGFAERHGFSGPVKILHRRHGDRSRYVLLVGDYTDFAEAESALATLPPELRRARPFVRSLPTGVEPTAGGKAD